MITSVCAGVRKRPWAALCLGTCLSTFLGMVACVTAQTASAADCPGHPDALGTSRTLVVDPREHPRIGTMQYAETLPLEDHEVVLTFDDGPLPKYSNQILQILADQCVKATFFTIGSQANASPGGVRKVRDAGHTVATHTQNHPSNMHRLPIDRASKEIDDGIASVTAALADGTAPAPFFRIPGLARNAAIEEYVASKGIQLWSADFLADDWRHVSPQRVYDLAIQRLKAKGKGILLLHDIQPRTVTALPRILHELKARGYRIVQVVPATPERPATPTEPQQWQLHPAAETVAISRWPKIPTFVFAGTDMLPAPALSNLDWRDTDLAYRTRLMRAVPLPQEALWPRPSQLAQASAAITLPIPAASVFKIPETTRVTMLAAAPAHRVEQAASTPRETEELAKPVSARSRAAASRQAARSKHAAHQAPHAGHAAPKHAAQVKKNGRSVRVASLKKR
ncbi:polysaccharide deacetylase family protein [Bradyrhizobium sp. Ash2021]|nr:polysaccharide deacetylase family protein [Bradyrhizobium sp. Ash2021]WMT71744.1 polysaccharide deacetylase family protein [Bradyrhizobium sp. Ash2021]